MQESTPSSAQHRLAPPALPARMPSASRAPVPSAPPSAASASASCCAASSGLSASASSAGTASTDSGVASNLAYDSQTCGREGAGHGRGGVSGEGGSEGLSHTHTHYHHHHPARLDVPRALQQPLIQLPGALAVALPNLKVDVCLRAGGRVGVGGGLGAEGQCKCTQSGPSKHSSTEWGAAGMGGSSPACTGRGSTRRRRAGRRGAHLPQHLWHVEHRLRDGQLIHRPRALRLAQRPFQVGKPAGWGPRGGMGWGRVGGVPGGAGSQEGCTPGETQ